MTEFNLDELKELAESQGKASDGPWQLDIVDPERRHDISGPCNPPDPEAEMHIGEVRGNKVDGEFICKARNTDITALVAEIERLTSSLRRCAVAASNSTSGDEEKDDAAIGGAMEMALDDIEGFVNDQVADLECAVAQRDVEIERLRKCCDLHRSMVLGGERPSETSEQLYSEAMDHD